MANKKFNQNSLLEVFYEHRPNDADVKLAVDLANATVNALENKSGAVMVEFMAAFLYHLADNQVIPDNQKETMIARFSIVAAQHAIGVLECARARAHGA